MLVEEIEKGARIREAAIETSKKMGEKRSKNAILYRLYNNLLKNEEYKKLIEEARRKAWKNKREKKRTYLDPNTSNNKSESQEFKHYRPSTQDIKNVKNFIDSVYDIVEENKMLKSEIENLKRQLEIEQKEKQQLMEDNKFYASIFH